MKSIFSRIASLLLAVMLCFSSILVSPSQAQGVISIQGGPNGVTITPGTAPDMTNIDNAYDKVGDTVVSKSKNVAKTVTSVCSIICFVALLISITKLAASNGSPMMRHAALMGILWSGSALALFGGAWVVVSFFWNFLT